MKHWMMGWVVAAAASCTGTLAVDEGNDLAGTGGASGENRAEAGSESVPRGGAAGEIEANGGVPGTAGSAEPPAQPGVLATGGMLGTGGSVMPPEPGVLATGGMLAADGTVMPPEPGINENLIPRDPRPGIAQQGNPEGCPATPPGHLSQCEGPEGSVCSYLGPDDTGMLYYTECGCWAASSTELKWDCYSEWNEVSEFCPESEPEQGSACNYGISCPYLSREHCVCARIDWDADPAWRCENFGRSGLPGHPTTIDETKAVSELTEEDRVSWCEWYTDAYLPAGANPTPPGTPDAEGYVTVGLSEGGSFSCLGAAPDVAAEDCRKNLALSTCSAPVSELSDCVLTILDYCMPAPRGCARYLETPGCEGTMVLAMDDTLAYVPLPKLKVE